MTQLELGAWATITFKLKQAPAQTTVSDILRKAIMIMDKAYGDGNSRKPLRVTSQALEDRLWESVQMVEAKHVCLSRELIRLKALDLQK
jgi:hypothetical protein